MPYISVTFVQATFVMLIFVHISNISAVTNPMFTKLFRPNFWRSRIFFYQNLVTSKLFWNQNVLGQHFFGAKIFFELRSFRTPQSFWLKFCQPRTFIGPTFLYPELLDQNFFGIKIFLDLKFF